MVFGPIVGLRIFHGLFGSLFFALVKIENVVGRAVLALLTPLFAHLNMRGGLRLDYRRLDGLNAIDFAHRPREAPVNVPGRLPPAS